MTRAAAPVAKLSRSIGSAARPAARDFPGPALLPKYAELLRSRTTRKEQSDAHSHTRGMMTSHIPAPPQPNPINLPSAAHPSPSGRRTPVPILFNPQQHYAAPTSSEPAHKPEVHFVCQNQRDPLHELEGIENIDVDEAARKAAAS